MTPRTLSNHWGLLLSLALLMSTLNSKAMGLAWLLLVLAGAWAFIQNRPMPSPMADARAVLWLSLCASALLIKTAAMVHWNDPWGERHGEWRLFIGALAVYALLRWSRLTRTSLVMMAHALTLSSAAGLAWVAAFGRDAVPTHPIPWAGAMAMISAMLLALALKSDFSAVQRRIWWAGSLLAVMAVLASQSRGAYPIVLWWLALNLYTLAVTLLGRKHGPDRPLGKRIWAMLAACVIGLIVFSQTPVFERPVQAIQKAVDEFQVSRASITAGANSSVGARLFMWQQSLIAIEQSPWFGHGHDGRKNLMQQWAQSAQSDEVRRLGHVHNEYLHQLLDHGLLGLSSQLLYLAGLALLGWRLLKHQQHTAALALSGMAFVHLTSSMSNVNFAHNYYTASLAFLIGLSLWLTRLEA